MSISSNPQADSLELRAYQHDIIARARSQFQSGRRRVAIVSPTGSGKNTLAGVMAAGAAARGHRTIFLVHRRELLRQTSNAFVAAGIQHGVMAAGNMVPGNELVQVGSISTIAKVCRSIAPPDFLIFDEAHHLPAPGWSSIQNAFPKAFTSGLTATPLRLDGQGFASHFDAMVVGPSIRQLQRDGYLARCRHLAPSELDLTGVRRARGDYVASDLAAAVDRSSLLAQAVAAYQRFTPGKRAIVFAVNVDQSERIAAAFRAAGITAEHVDGATKAEERDGAIARFASGETLVLSNVNLFVEGFNLPTLETVIMLRATASVSLFLQMIGRSLRPDAGKQHAVVLDLVGNWRRHGLVDDDRKWSLNPPPIVPTLRTDLRVCPACSLVSLPHPFCAACGAPPCPRRADDAAAWRALISEPGLLARLKSGSVGQHINNADSEHQLRMLALARGYKPGWAYHRWREIVEARGAA